MLSSIIVAPCEDVHALSVAREIRILGYDCTIFDSATLPDETSLTFNFSGDSGQPAWLSIGDQVWMENTFSVWLRRPMASKVSNSIKQLDAAEFARRSTKEALFGSLSALSKLVINDPGSSEKARLKIYQTQMAKLHGFAVPNTVVSNSPGDILEFSKINFETIFKVVSPWFYGLAETRLFCEAATEDIERTRYCPTIFQQFIEGDNDLRITVVGDEIFPARIKIGDGRSKIDGRMDRVGIEPYDISDDFRYRLLKLHRTLGLKYGAYDFRLSNDKVPYFLEVNPDGQFLFVEIETGMCISKSIARLLSEPPDG